MNTKLSLALALSMAAVSAQATVIFQNTGNTNGWDRVWIEYSSGSITEVANCYKGTNGLKVEVTYSPTYRGRYHTECRKTGLATSADNYYGWAIWISPNWETVNQNFNIQQFIGNWNHDACPDANAGSPTTMTWLYGTNLYTRVKTGTICDQSTTTYTYTNSLSKGVWHRIVMRGKWKADNTGVFEGWLDGTRAFSRTNAPTWMSGSNTGVNFAIGMYANGWHDDGKMVGTQATRRWWIDSIRLASTYAEADPMSW